MQILIATTTHSYRSRQLEVIGLQDQLLSMGATVDVLTLPFAMKSSTIVAQATAYRLLDVSQSADWLLSLSAPTNLLQHPKKIVVVSDDMGLLTDCWEKKFLASTSASSVAEHNLLIRAESFALTESQLKLCFSSWTSNRLRRCQLDGFKIVEPNDCAEQVMKFIASFSKTTASTGRLSA